MDTRRGGEGRCEADEASGTGNGERGGGRERSGKMKENICVMIHQNGEQLCEGDMDGEEETKYVIYYIVVYFSKELTLSVHG